MLPARVRKPSRTTLLWPRFMSRMVDILPRDAAMARASTCAHHLMAASDISSMPVPSFHSSSLHATRNSTGSYRFLRESLMKNFAHAERSRENAA